MKDRGMGRVVGICGRSGSGKTTVCKAFEELGAKSIDTDRVYRDLTRADDDGIPSECVRMIANKFGGKVIASDGSLNRAYLARIVFGDKEKLSLLNSITHKRIMERTEAMIFEYLRMGTTCVLVDAPALFESGFDKKCDAVVCVTAPEDTLVRRIVARDGITPEQAMRRLASQIPDEELRARADFVFLNDGESPIGKQAEMILGEILDGE